MQYTIEEIVHMIANSDRNEVYEDNNGDVFSPYKYWWRELFKEAKLTAKAIRRESKQNNMIERDDDEIMVQIIVDQWMAEVPDQYQSHSHPRDDQQCNDMSCMQALAKQQETFLKDIRRAFINACERKDNAAKERLRKLYYEEKATQLSSIDYGMLDEPKTKQPVFTPIEQEMFDDCEQHVRMLEYHESFHQEPECDPDDARFIGKPPKSDSWDDKMKSDCIDKGRGAVGTLGGLYRNTRPEPAYYTKQQRRIMQRTMLNSTNADEIKLATYMNGRKMTPEARQKFVNRQVLMNQLP